MQPIKCPKCLKSVPLRNAPAHRCGLSCSKCGKAAQKRPYRTVPVCVGCGLAEFACVCGPSATPPLAAAKGGAR